MPKADAFNCKPLQNQKDAIQRVASFCYSLVRIRTGCKAGNPNFWCRKSETRRNGSERSRRVASRCSAIITWYRGRRLDTSNRLFLKFISGTPFWLSLYGMKSQRRWIKNVLTVNKLWTDASKKKGIVHTGCILYRKELGGIIIGIKGVKRGYFVENGW